MKKGRFLLVGVFVMSFAAVSAQGDYAFKVLANKGTNEVKSGGTWTAIKTGASLKETDELKLSENSYVGLVHATGKPLELKASGSYKVADLAGKIDKGTGVLNKYTDFILSSNSAEAKKNRLSATGGMHRGIGIKIFLPTANNADVMNNILFINWEAKGGPYTLSIQNMFGDELAKIKTPENGIQVDLNAPEYASESAIVIDLKGTTENGDTQYLVKKLSTAQADKVKKDLAEITRQSGEETALNKFILAGFYEEHKLLIDAIAAYEQAIKMAPDVPSYKEAYEEFLLRTQMKKLPQP